MYYKSHFFPFFCHGVWITKYLKIKVLLWTRFFFSKQGVTGKNVMTFTLTRRMVCSHESVLVHHCPGLQQSYF